MAVGRITTISGEVLSISAIKMILSNEIQVLNLEILNLLQLSLWNKTSR